MQFPNIRLSFDGVSLRLAAIARHAAEERRTLRFICSAEEMLSRAEAEARLGQLVEDVLGRLDDRGVRATNAALRWERVLASRSDPDEAVFCEAAGALQRDPYQIEDADALLIEQAAVLFEGEALLEFLAGVAGRHAYSRDQLAWIAAAEARPSEAARIPALGASGRVHGAGARHPAKAWVLGYRRAREFRRQVGLHSSDRMGSVSVLAQRLGASPTFAPAPRIEGLRALRSETGDDVFIHLRETGSESSNLFGFARACGDVVCFPAPARSVVNDLRSAYRQAAGRAFAAEFLAPIDEIKSMEADGLDTLSMAAELGVSSEVIDLQIENAERIDEACRA